MAEKKTRTGKAPAPPPSERAGGEVAALKRELALVYKVNEELRAEIEQLTAHAGKANSTPPAAHHQHGFTLDGEKYGFNYPAIHHKGQRLTSLEIMNDEALQRELVERGSGMIKKIL